MNRAGIDHPLLLGGGIYKIGCMTAGRCGNTQRNEFPPVDASMRTGFVVQWFKIVIHCCLVERGYSRLIFKNQTDDDSAVHVFTSAVVDGENKCDARLWLNRADGLEIAAKPDITAQSVMTRGLFVCLRLSG